MKKTFNVDPELLKRARAACEANTDTETIRLGLQNLVQEAAYKRIAAYLGSEKGNPLYDVPRRREKPARKSKTAKRTKVA